jgi:uroporphyrinogen-III decarboxylase
VTVDEVALSMTAKERMIKALHGEKPDVLPAVPAYLGLFLADFEQAFYMEQYRSRLRECGTDRYHMNHEEDTFFRARAIFQSYGIFKVKPDWIEVYQGISRAWTERLEIVRVGEQLYFEDLRSGKRVAMKQARFPQDEAELSDENPAASDILDLTGEIKDSEDVDRLIPIRSAAELLESGEMDLLRRVVNDYGDRFFITSILDTPFSYVSDYLGFFGLMMTVHDRPDLLHYMLERQLAQTEEVMAAIAQTGLHGIYVQEVFTGADVISPRAYEEFVFTYNKSYFKRMRELGLLPVHYVCGDVMPRLEQMAECEVAAIAVEESKKNFRIEIEEVVKRVGERVTVFGNIDAVHYGLYANTDEMAAEVNRQANLGARAKGFVVSTGSPFPLDTNPHILDTMVATAHALPIDSSIVTC